MSLCSHSFVLSLANCLQLSIFSTDMRVELVSSSIKQICFKSNYSFINNLMLLKLERIITRGLYCSWIVHTFLMSSSLIVLITCFYQSLKWLYSSFRPSGTIFIKRKMFLVNTANFCLVVVWAVVILSHDPFKDTSPASTQPLALWPWAVRVLLLLNSVLLLT